MVSGIGLSKELNCSLIIIWEKDSGLNCNYDDLFRKKEEIRVVNFDLRSYIIQRFRGVKKILLLFQKILGFGFIMFDRDMNEYVWKSGTNFINPDTLRNISGDIYFNLCNEFYFKRENLQYFLPNENLQIKIDLIRSKFAKNTIGLHIRRTDHKLAFNESPLYLFIEKINEEIRQDENVFFYLATDDSDVKKMLHAKFGYRILFSNIKIDRSSLDGMQGAIIDLYALASTKKIYGSFFSSYSDIAARIGNIPLIVVKT